VTYYVEWPKLTQIQLKHKGISLMDEKTCPLLHFHAKVGGFCRTSGAKTEELSGVASMQGVTEGVPAPLLRCQRPADAL
jgi:hypothetical protein